MDSAGEYGDARALRRDNALGGAVILLFSFALGVSGVAVPLVAVDAGYNVAAIGVLVAISGLAQLLARVRIASVMQVVPDKALVIVSAGLIAASCIVLAASHDLWWFVAAQVLQGAARAYFWTGAQTHVVRTGPSSLKALASMNLLSGIGALTGPAVAGLLTEQSGQIALLAAAAVGSVATLLSAFLLRLRPFGRVELADHAPRVRVWRRTELRAGLSMCTIAGAWRGVLSSYVPVVLALAGIAPTTIGLLVTVGNVANLVGGAAVGWFRAAHAAKTLLIGGLSTGVGMAAIGPLAQFPMVVAALLVVSGLGAGVLLTVGTASVADVVHPEERGDVIAATGTFRAIALVTVPVVTAGLALILPLAAAMAVTGMVAAAPLLIRNGRRSG